MIYLIKSHVNGDLGVSDHIVEKADPVIGTYDTVDDAIQFLKEQQLITKLQKEPIREYDESTVNELIEVIQRNYG
jgi:hypothetical protein